MVDDPSFFVRFWGVRGSVPAPGPDTVIYGGNTSCIEIRCDNHILIFDAGSGFRLLGRHLLNEECTDFNLFFSHCHYDHINGLPFFLPLYNVKTNMSIWSGHCPETTQSLVRGFMRKPFFPVPPEIFKATVDYKDFTCGDILKPISADENISIKTCALNHDGGSTGYRVEYQGKSICYITDTEHVKGAPDQTILDFIHQADIVIYDATYCDHVFDDFIGFGHSTWQEGARLCDAANVEKYVIFHHRPSYDDVLMAGIEQKAAMMRTGSVVAREGMMIVP